MAEGVGVTWHLLARADQWEGTTLLQMRVWCLRGEFLIYAVHDAPLWCACRYSSRMIDDPTLIKRTIREVAREAEMPDTIVQQLIDSFHS